MEYDYVRKERIFISRKNY